MRRFWKEVSLHNGDDGYTVQLDGRLLKTPKKHALYLSTQALAEAVKAEWDVVGEVIDPLQMPMTGFANAAIDHVMPDPRAFAKSIAAYAESDAFCYRADAEDALSAKQAELWDPWLEWARGCYDVSFIIVHGIMHQAQPKATLDILTTVVAAHGPFKLAAMAKLAHLTGSLIAVLAIVDVAADATTIWQATCLEELWQEELWGADHWAQKNRADREAEFMAAVQFLELLRG
jgi:chaperone required for assembly of F1-ATPase